MSNFLDDRYEEMNEMDLGPRRFDLEDPESALPSAWSNYHIYGTSGDSIVTVHWSTNDDRDHGFPTKDAADTYTFKTRPGKTALQQALDFCGVSRQGVACVVSVFHNGIRI